MKVLAQPATPTTPPAYWARRVRDTARKTCTLLKVHKKNMLFEYTRRRGVRSPVTDAVTFKVGHLKQTMAHEAKTVDLSHLIDTSYNYHSPRELRWHLAERFGMAPEAIALREHH